MKMLSLIILFIVLVGAIYGQDVLPQNTSWIRLESDPQGAEIWMGDSLVGLTPMNIDGKLARGLVVYSPARNGWNAEAKRLPDSLLNYTQGVIVLTFPRESVIRSIPSDAAVYLRDEIIGRTPMRIRIAQSDTFRLSKPGFESGLVVMHAGEEPDVVYLTPDNRTAIVQQATALKPGFRLPPARILAGCAAGLGAGIAAVVLKQEADRRYDLYRQGDASARQKALKYDVYAGVALAVMEASLLYLLVELFDNS